jgi:hypothetical protein
VHLRYWVPDDSRKLPIYGIKVEGIRAGADSPHAPSRPKATAFAGQKNLI